MRIGERAACVSPNFIGAVSYGSVADHLLARHGLSTIVGNPVEAVQIGVPSIHLYWVFSNGYPSISNV
jgi:hypothetical protein